MKISDSLLRSIDTYYNKNNLDEANRLISNLSGTEKELAQSYLSFKQSHFAKSYMHLLRASRNNLYSLETSDQIQLMREKIEYSPSVSEKILEINYLSGVLIWGLLACLISFNVVRSTLKATYKTILLSVSLILFISQFMMSYQFTVDKTNIYSGPSSIFSAEGSIPEGKILFGLEQDQWIKVYLPLEYRGWVKKSKIQEL